MIDGLVISAKTTNLKKIILVSVILGTLANSIISNQFSLNGGMQSHKVITHYSNKFLAYQKMIFPSLSARSFFSRSSSGSQYEYNNNNNKKNRKEYSSSYYTVPGGKKLLHKTFRIPEDVIDGLEKEAKSRDIPLSNLVNTILKNYLAADTHSEKSGYVITSKDFFRRMFSRVDDKYIGECGRELGHAVVDEYTYLYFPQLDSNSVIQFLESWFKRFQSYQHRFDEENNRHTFSLNHDINMNYSIVLKIILQGLIEPVTKSQVIFGELRTSSISFSFEV
jgi:hypothetical protein